MASIGYKGYEIQAVPYQLADSGNWTLEILIVRHTGTEIKLRKFGGNNRFKTKDEAVQYCFNFGKQTIDGKVKNCTVADL